jgi:hypothetical protein
LTVSMLGLMSVRMVNTAKRWDFEWGQCAWLHGYECIDYAMRYDSDRVDLRVIRQPAGENKAFTISLDLSLSREDQAKVLAMRFKLGC